MEKKVKKGKQPYPYRFRSDFHEPDWRRLPGYMSVTEDEWNSAIWQRRNSAKSVEDLKKALGSYLSEELALDILRDQSDRATMSMLIPPQMINTMKEGDLKGDPIRRYMAPAFSDRDVKWPNHPMATRDSLHEHEMWVVEGLTHRYPTKVLAEITSTCPQYCGHCTRMDLVGQSVPQIKKRQFEVPQKDRYQQIIDYLKKTPQVRDVVVSGGDAANVPPQQLEAFICGLLDVETIRDIRIATKGLAGLPQHFLETKTLKSLEAISTKARERGVDVAIHTHINHAQTVTPLVAKAAGKMLELGFRDVRNQGVMLRGVNDSEVALLDLCFSMLDNARIMPYYFYMCDMIPNSEHWRMSLATAQQLQHDIMGYLPGFATPRLLCDVPYVGKRWTHQCKEYDRVKGISYWTKNYLTSIEWDKPEMIDHLYEYYDPIDTLPEEGQQYWAEQLKK